MAYKILHLADLHLDIQFRDIGRAPHVANQRREGLRQALKRAFDLARQEQVNAVTLGGDLFEAERVSMDTMQFIRQQCVQLAPTLVFVAPGNHDPYTHKSPYAHVDWPANVYIFRDARLTPVTLSADLRLWGAGHDSPACYQPLLQGFHLPDTCPSVLLLHGTDRSLSLGQDKHAFCPFSAEEARGAGFQLALLGHIHHQRFSPAADPILCYPGSPEPLGFDEENGHSIVIAEWNGKDWRVENIDVSQWGCRTRAVDITGLHSREDVVERIRSLWPDERSKRLLACVTLKGQPAPTLDLDTNAIAAGLDNAFTDLRLENETMAPFDLTALQADQTTTGAFVRRMQSEIDKSKRAGDQMLQDKLTRALTYGLLALDGREIPSV